MKRNGVRPQPAYRGQVAVVAPQEVVHLVVVAVAVIVAAARVPVLVSLQNHRRPLQQGRTQKLIINLSFWRSDPDRSQGRFFEDICCVIYIRSFTYLAVRRC